MGGCHLLSEQARVARELLADLGTPSDESEMFYVARAVLETNAVRSELTAEEIVEWLPRRRSVPRREKVGDEFIEEFCASPYAPIHDPLIMAAVWGGLQKFMLHWLVNKRRPIETLFCRLVPLVLRHNWQSVVARWEKNQVGKKFTGHKMYSPNGLVERGVADYLCESGVMALDPKRNTFRWTISVCLKEVWHDLTGKVETEKKRRAPGYYFRNSDPQKWQLPLALETYADWLKEAGMPIVSVLGRSVGGKELPQGFVTRTVRTLEAPQRSTENIVLSRDTWLEASPEIDLDEATEALPAEVPNLQSGDENVRDTGGDIHGRDGEGKEPRLLLPDGLESEPG